MGTPARDATGMRWMARNIAFMLAGEAGVKLQRRFFARGRNRALRLALVVLLVDLSAESFPMDVASEVFRRSAVSG